MSVKLLFGNNISGTGKMISKNLKRFKFEVSHCSNTFDCLMNALEKDNYNAVFFFVKNETTELYEFISNVKSKFPGIKIYALLYSDSQVSGKKLLDADITAYYQMPFSINIFYFSVIKEFWQDIYIPVATSEFLIDKGIPSSTKGFYFLSLCVEMVSKDSDMLSNASKLLYPSVLEKMEASSLAWIERSIRNVSKMAFKNGIFFEFYPDDVKLSNKVFIKALADEYNKVSCNYPKVCIRAN